MLLKSIKNFYFLKIISFFITYNDIMMKNPKSEEGKIVKDMIIFVRLKK